MGPFERYSCSLCDLFLSAFKGEVNGEGSKKKNKKQKNTNKLVKSRRVKNQGLGSIHLTFKLP